MIVRKVRSQTDVQRSSDPLLGTSLLDFLGQGNAITDLPNSLMSEEVLCMWSENRTETVSGVRRGSHELIMMKEEIQISTE
jgi:hypothetical protein